MGFIDGLFPSSTRTSVSTSVSRVVSDNALPDSVKNGVLQALAKNGEIVDYINESFVGSMGRRAEKMYSYAEENYIHGMPSGELYLANQANDILKEVLIRKHDNTIQIEYSHFGPPNMLHIGWVSAIDTYGYDSSTNQLMTLSAQKKTPVYLKDMVVVVPASEAGVYSKVVLDQYGVPPCAGYTPERPLQNRVLNTSVLHTPVEFSSTATERHVLLTYCWKNGSQLEQESVVIPVTTFNGEKDYFQAKYTYQNKAHIFMYEDGAGLYPTLDQAYDVPTQVMGEFFPLTYFRFGKQPMNADKKSASYKNSKKMCK
jgi:hypothetical protein